jgi:hypothetical protein
VVKCESLDPEIRDLLGKKVSELGPMLGIPFYLADLGQIFLTRKRKESRPAADIVSRYA